RFDSFTTSLISLFVLLTTENYPMALYPAYEKHPTIAILYFWSFLMIGCTLILSTLLGAVVEAYRDIISVQAVRELQDERDLIKRGFRLIAEKLDEKSAERIPEERLSGGSSESLLGHPRDEHFGVACKQTLIEIAHILRPGVPEARIVHLVRNALYHFPSHSHHNHHNPHNPHPLQSSRHSSPTPSPRISPRGPHSNSNPTPSFPQAPRTMGSRSRSNTSRSPSRGPYRQPRRKNPWCTFKSFHRFCRKVWRLKYIEDYPREHSRSNSTPPSPGSAVMKNTEDLSSNSLDRALDLSSLATPKEIPFELTNPITRAAGTIIDSQSYRWVLLVLELVNLTALMTMYNEVLFMRRANAVFVGGYLCDLVVQYFGMNTCLRRFSHIRLLVNSIVVIPSAIIQYIVMTTWFQSYIYPDVSVQYWRKVEVFGQTFLLLRLLTSEPIWRKVERLIGLSQLLSSTFWPIITYLAMMLILMMYFFAAVGHILFAPGTPSTLSEEEWPSARASFETPGSSFILIFQVFGGSSWHEPMIEVMREYGMIRASAFFATFYLTANTILVNLIVAVFADVMMALRSWTYVQAMKNRESKRTFVKSLLRRQRSVFSWNSLQETSAKIKKETEVYKKQKKKNACHGFGTELDDDEDGDDSGSGSNREKEDQEIMDSKTTINPSSG
ncbi:hypothetical protein AAMO2058_001707500, partial [Amorphochlora amoebiformis]